MAHKRGIFQRSLSAFLAFAIVFGLVAVHIPGFVTQTNAADTTVTLPTYHVNNRDRKDGLYTIHPAGNTDLALDIGMNSVTVENTNTVLDYTSDDPSQRFVIQIDQSDNASGTTKVGSDAIYGIRSLPSRLWVGAASAGAVVQQTSLTNYRNTTCQWQFIDNGDGTVLILHTSTQQYLYAPTLQHGQFPYLGALPSGEVPQNYRWVLNQTHMQDTYFTTGIYWLETRLPDSAGVEPTDTTLGTPKYVISVDGTTGSSLLEAYQPAAAGTENATTGEVTWTEPAEPYESQQFVIQKVSGGFYSIVNISTGCYLAVDKDGNIVNGRSSALAPNPEERWIIYPSTQTGNKTVISTGNAADPTSDVGRFRIISAVDGSQLTTQQTTGKTRLSGTTSTLATSPMENYKTQDWLLKDIRLDPNNVEKGDTQITDSGVFADTFDASSTVTLPIKIFDYAADGMLFEYAANDTHSQYSYHYVGEGKGNFVQNAYGGYDNVGNGNGDYLGFRMGNNMAYSMMSQSNGGLNGTAWDQTQGGTAYVGNGSNSFDYNKYWCPYISHLRLNASVADNDGKTYSQVVLEYVFKKPADGYKAAMIVDGGTMNAAESGVNLSTNTLDQTIVDRMQDALGYVMFGEQTFGRATVGLLEPGLKTVDVNGKTYTLPRYRQEAVEYIAMVMQRSLEIRYQSGDGYYNYNYVDGETSFADLASGMDLAALLRGDTKVNPDITSNTEGYTGVLEFYNGTNSSAGEDTLTNNFTRYGSYTETNAKSAQLIGTWADVKDNIKTCMDAAYWMLNSIFLEGSYNAPQDRYNSLLLTKVTDQSGKTGYIFDSTFITNSSSEAGNSAVVYDSATGTIRNSSAAGKSYTYWGVNRSAATYPFTPVRTDYQDQNGNIFNGDGTASNPKGYQNQTETPYILDGGIVKSQAGGSEPEYTNANYNFVLQSNAYFVYHAEDQLFFDFEGDDDVYLFINGELVLDIGGAHTVTGTKINLNDYVNWAHETLKTDPNNERAKKLALVEGDTYSFDFYYMERHGWGSNMRIFTNFQLASGELEAAKSAEQNDKPLSYGSVVDETQNVEYTFSLKNTGTANLVMPSFYDAAIGVTVSYETGLTVAEGENGVTVFDRNGETLEFTDLVFTYQHVGTSEAVQTLQFDNEEDMLKWLTHQLVIDRYIAGAGTYGLLTVGGIYYHLTNQQIADGAFHNEVEVSAFVRNDGHSLTVDQENGPLNMTAGSQLYDSADFSVFLLSRPLYYHWRGNELMITVEDILNEVQPAANDKDNPLSNLVKPTITAITGVRLVGGDGEEDNIQNIDIDDAFNVYATYTKTGIKLIYLDIDYTYKTTDENGAVVDATATATIPVQIFVLDVSASVYVLDYGLRLELTFGELFGGSILTVDGRDTTFEVLGVAREDTVPVYISSDNAVTGDKINSIKFNSVSYDSAAGVWHAANGENEYTPYDGAFKVFNMDAADSDTVAVTYTPTEFMEGTDDIYIAVRVRETDYTPDAMGNTDIHNEVEMFKKLTVLPATVVYYEDDFADIQYSAPAGTQEQLGTTSSVLTQGSAAETPYGQDSTYQGSANATMSGNTLTAIHLTERDHTGTVATFDFTGTGFELISRTNSYDSASVVVKIYSAATDDDGNVIYSGGRAVKGSLLNNLPVITEFTNANGKVCAHANHSQSGVCSVCGITVPHNYPAVDSVCTVCGGAYSVDTVTDPYDPTDRTDRDYRIDQVPVIRVDTMPYGTYVVEISGTPTLDFTNMSFDESGNVIGVEVVPTTVYIDGIRIFQPLGSAHADYYKYENGATFTELRDMILAGNAAVSVFDKDSIVYTGNKSWTENRNGILVTPEGDKNIVAEYYGNMVSGIDQYMLVGPNNEAYLNGINTNQAVIFYVAEENAANHSVQIAVRAIDAGLFLNGESTGTVAGLYQGIASGDGYAWQQIADIRSGTEQYYTIDYAACPTVEVDGKSYYQVALTVRGGMVSFSTVKLVGMCVAEYDLGDATSLRYTANGMLENHQTSEQVASFVWNLFAISEQMSADTYIDLDNNNPSHGDISLLGMTGLMVAAVLCLAFVVTRKKSF